MPLFSQQDRAFAQAIAGLAYCNPFLPQRIELERQALGQDFIQTRADWNVDIQSRGKHPNIDAMRNRANALAARARDQLVGGLKTTPADLDLYESLVFFVLFHRYLEPLQHTVERATEGQLGVRDRVTIYKDFQRDWESLLVIPGVKFPDDLTPEHLFACFFQLRRAFHYVFANIVGLSQPIIQLRARVWQSVFTHDMRRYRRVLFNRMGDFACLITGDSGTGKELVARAIGLSRYIPFDPARLVFTEDVLASFQAVNLSALSPTLIESELFGHCRGAFTGALQDRAGWFETCRPLGTVFLDEIGEVDMAIQVKLLRVLQTRAFQRLGDIKPMRFEGKVIAATNRNLATEMTAGHFREDLYYRLCSDIIRTPSLREQLGDRAGELENLTLFLARRLANEQEAPALAAEVMDHIVRHIGMDYCWPGNVRELEQCVRNVMIRGEYHPPKAAKPERSPLDRLGESIRAGRLTADELMRGYCTLVYAQTHNYQETARRLKLDHRTVKAYIDPQWLEDFGKAEK